MGASTFEHRGSGATKEEAFRAAVDDARYEFGHGGYTGTLAEKGSFVEIPFMVENRLPTYNEAVGEAYRLIDRGDPRIDNKWGPAGCIEIQPNPEETLTTGFVPCPVCQQKHQAHRTPQGWKLSETKWGLQHKCPGVGQLAAKGTRASGIQKPKRAFLFFGWASS